MSWGLRAAPLPWAGAAREEVSSTEREQNVGLFFGDAVRHLPQVGDDPHRPVERRKGHHTVPVPQHSGDARSTWLPLPDIGDNGDGALVDNLGPHELGRAILAVLWLIRCQLLRVAKVADPDLLTA